MRQPEFLYHLPMPPKRIAIISTGGTIEKTYDELSGVLSNQLWLHYATRSTWKSVGSILGRQQADDKHLLS